MKLETIKKRKSIRTYDNQGLSDDELNKVQQIIDNLDNPFDIDVKLTILEKDKYNLESPVLVGEKYYITAVTKKDDDYLLGLGYLFEDLILKLEEIDLSTVIIAGTYKKDNFIKALNLNDDQELVLITPVGHKADKMSFRETLMRKGIKADERLEVSKLFFLNDFNNPMNQLDDSLQAIRLSPSAVNKQPWRILTNDEGVHFYVNFNTGYERMQMIDMGIALRNFTYVNTKTGTMQFKKPDVDTNYQYVISYIYKQ